MILGIEVKKIITNTGVKCIEGLVRPLDPNEQQKKGRTSSKVHLVIWLHPGVQQGCEVLSHTVSFVFNRGVSDYDKLSTQQ